MTPQIRKMKRSDIPQLIALWKQTNLSLVNLTREKKETELMMKLNTSSCFVVADKRKIIGSIMGTFNGKRAWIYHLAVHPAFQGKGIGSFLLQKAEKALRKTGAKRLLLGADKSNLKAMKFYKKYGFAEITDGVFFGKNI